MIHNTEAWRGSVACLRSFIQWQSWDLDPGCVNPIVHPCNPHIRLYIILEQYGRNFIIVYKAIF